MSSKATDVKYIIKLHRDGIINDEQLRKMIDALNEPPRQTSEVKEVQSSALENLRKRRRNKKKRKRQAARNTQTNIDVSNDIVESEQVSEEILRLVDKPSCGYFKAYEIDVYDYQDPSILFQDKKSLIIDQIIKDTNEYNGTVKLV